eukprot:TRINITY_DN5004_c0_g2_i1.p2 TRINITY_DN5004_c0_g2~~TRINITY_DN5004_c0_g2_i1.p2  ORF type:complete len:133 (-),score=28.49 TRINITY_DN5004_c0_g2_i1:291-689(-)
MDGVLTENMVVISPRLERLTITPGMEVRGDDVSVILKATESIKKREKVNRLKEKKKKEEERQKMIKIKGSEGEKKLKTCRNCKQDYERSAECDLLSLACQCGKKRGCNKCYGRRFLCSKCQATSVFRHNIFL